jgi:hypothetical protein
MLNKKIKFLFIGVFIISIIILTQISLVQSATGSIRINRTTASVPNQQVTAGDEISLYFGDPSIKWTGHYFYLLISHDLSEIISTGDYFYSPMFPVAELQNPHTLSYYSNSEGSWVIGNNWINGTFASNMASGKYSIKAVDFSTVNSETYASPVAVTDTYINVNTPQIGQYTLQITPNDGPGGAPIRISGSGYPANVAIDIAYYDPTFSEYRAWKREVTDASGKFSFATIIPDLGKSNIPGDSPETFNVIQFKTQYQGLTCAFATYNQYARGIKSIGGQTAYGLYGNGSDLVSTVKVKPGDTFTIAGKGFPQGVVYVLLDNQVAMGTVTRSQWATAERIGSGIANTLGDFEAKVTIPSSTYGGEHYICVEDTHSSLMIKILVTEGGTLEVSPPAGAGGANIQFTGSGYPPLSAVNIKYQDTLYNSWNYWTTVDADAYGNINLNTKIPDLKNIGFAGDYPHSSLPMMFRTESNEGRIFAYTSYTQYARGLKQVGDNIATNLYGASTNFANYNMKVHPGDTIAISGRYFCPGVIYIRWDGEASINTITPDQWTRAEVIGTTIANEQGTFDITIKIPSANSGLHWVYIEDTQTSFIIRIPVEATPTPTPTPTSSGESSPSPSTKPSSPPPSSDKVTPTINLQCRSIPIDTGYRVEISGTCTNNNIGLANKAIQLYNSKDGGKTWEPLSVVNTNNEGKFNAIWISLTSGTFLIKAECIATTEYNSATTTVNIAIEPILANNNGETVFTLTSNSTISELIFNSKTSELSFTATGTTGTIGYTNINIPKTLINNPSNLKIYIDGKETPIFNSSQEKDTITITLTYTHSTHTITMKIDNNQNQNQQWTIIAASIIITTIITIIAISIFLKKKQHNKK